MSKMLYYPEIFDTFKNIVDGNDKIIQVNAIKGDVCSECVFYKSENFCYSTACKSEERGDNKNIIFVRE